MIMMTSYSLPMFLSESCKCYLTSCTQHGKRGQREDAAPAIKNLQSRRQDKTRTVMIVRRACEPTEEATPESAGIQGFLEIPIRLD